MKLIPIINSDKKIIVDDCDYYLNKYQWKLSHWLIIQKLKKYGENLQN